MILLNAARFRIYMVDRGTRPGKNLIPYKVSKKLWLILERDERGYTWLSSCLTVYDHWKPL